MSHQSRRHEIMIADQKDQNQNKQRTNPVIEYNIVEHVVHLKNGINSGCDRCAASHS
jgi:hypothetical protein